VVQIRVGHDTVEVLGTASTRDAVHGTTITMLYANPFDGFSQAQIATEFDK
jgi:hypothetical protein